MFLSKEMQNKLLSYQRNEITEHHWFFLKNLFAGPALQMEEKLQALFYLF
jgi:hypothetical protein